MEQRQRLRNTYLWMCWIALLFFPAAEPSAFAQTETESASARDLTLSYNRAIKLLGSDEPRRGLTLLHQVLQVLDNSDDVLIPMEDGTRSSLKAACLDRLRNSSADEIGFYEQQFGPEARDQLRIARVNNDLERLKNVSRKFFFTAAGVEATRELSVRKLDRGDAMGAALTLSRFRRTARQPEQFEPQLSLTLAAAWMQAGLPIEARAAIARLRTQGVTSIPGPAGELALGPEGSWPDWLSKPGRTGAKADANWPLFLGNIRRSRTSEPIIPRWKPLWTVKTLQTLVVETEDERKLTDAGLKRMSSEIADLTRERRRRLSLVPAPVPLLVGNRVLFRSPLTISAIRARAGDGFAAGELEWETYKPDPYVLDAFRQTSDRDNGLLIKEEAERYSWHDLTSGTITSNGAFVFAVEETDRSTLNPRRSLREQPSRPNYIRAYELASGSVAWQIGGESGIHVAGMRDSIFLGPPIPFGDDLLLIVASRDEVRLLQIHIVDPLATQPEIRLVWSQQLGRIESRRIAASASLFSQARTFRMGGLSPSYSKGVLVCPTGCGEIVALHPGTRTIAWRHRYPGPGFPVRDSWGDSIPRIAGDSVVCSPAGGPTVFCLDLQTGQRRWMAARPPGSQLVVTDDAAVCVGSEQTIAYRLSDGQALWPEPLKLEQPCGRGLVHGDTMSVPLANGSIATFELATGRILSNFATGIALGNLLAVDGLIISQSPTQLVAFGGLKSVRDSVAADLSRNPTDPDLLISAGLLRIQDGELDEGLKALAQAAAGGKNIEATRLLVNVISSLKGDQLTNSIPVLDELQPIAPIAPMDMSGLVSPLATVSAMTSNLASSPRLIAALLRLRAGNLTEAQLGSIVDRLVGMADQTNDQRFVVRETGAMSESRYLASEIRKGIALVPEPDRDRITKAIDNEVRSCLKRDQPRRAYRLFQWMAEPSPETQELLAGGLRESNPALAIELYSAFRRTKDLDRRLRSIVAMVDLLREHRPDRAADLIRELQTESKGHEASAAVMERWKADPSMARLVSTGSGWPAGKLTVRKIDAFQRKISTPISQREAGGSSWSFIHQGKRIVGLNKLHEERFVVADNSSLPRRVLQSPDLYLVETATTLVLPRTRTRFEAYDLLDESGKPTMMWEASVAAPREPQAPAAFRGPPGTRPVGPVAGQTLLVTQGSFLVAYDLRSGATLWSREIQELATTHIHADDKVVAVVSLEAVRLFSVFDGTPLGTRVGTYSGANYVVEQGRGRVLLEPDFVESGETLKQTQRLAFAVYGDEEPVWQHSYQQGAVASSGTGGYCAVATPNGLVQVVRLEDGRVMASTNQKPIPELQRVLLHVTDDRFVVFTDRKRFEDRYRRPFGQASQFNQPGSGYGVQGLAVAFDRDTAEVEWKLMVPDSRVLWHASTSRRRHILAKNLPVLVLFGPDREATYRVLDCRTGEFVFTSEELIFSSGGSVNVQREQRTIQLSVGTGAAIQIDFPEENSEP